MKRILTAIAISACITGCGSSDDSDDLVFFPPASNTISGSAEAPGGSVAYFEPQSLMQIAANFLIRPATAAITGLDPITGATVELIRVDNNGDQIGDVLATTSTSITGEYTLTLPADVNLSGNLVVRITGTGGRELRAQVVERSVDINPVSEFVLQKFIDDGADLENLETNSVVRLVGTVEEFDLTATSDLTSMLASLEAEVGDFVDNQIDVIQSVPADTNSLSGSYKNFGFSLGLHDSDGAGYGTIGIDTFNADIAFSTNGSGLNVALSSDESGWSNFSASDNGASGLNWSLKHYTEIDLDTENLPANFNTDNVLSIDSPFSEEIDGDYGWRFLPALVLFQKAPNDSVFISQNGEAIVRYQTIDTNADGIKDAVDPALRSGDEVERSIEFTMQLPSGATTSSLNGDYGRVYLGAFADNNGTFEVETEVNILSFDGAGTLDIGEANAAALSRSPAGSVTASSTTVPAESGLGYSLSASGQLSIDDGSGLEAVDGWLNNSGNLLVLNEVENNDSNPADVDTNDVFHSITTAVKLPSQQLDITGKRYRVIFTAAALEGTSVSISNFRFNSWLNITGVSTATLSGVASSITQATRLSEVETESTTIDASVSIDSFSANGAIDLSFNTTDGAASMSGYMNQDGSLGVLRFTFIPTGQDINEVGLVYLVETPAL